ncbi:SHOCT domain-containing protein [Oscillibacter sp.]
MTIEQLQKALAKGRITQEEYDRINATLQNV